MDYQQLIKETALADERIVVMTAENRAVLRQLPPVLGNRFIDTGITEQCMIGVAAGLASRGRIPICHALTTFLTMRAFEFIRTDVGISNAPVKVSGFIPGFLSDANGPTHQALEDISIMAGIPGMHVFAPADEDDMLKMMPSIWSSEHPTYYRLLTNKPLVEHVPFEYGKAEIFEIGSDVNILTYGFLFGESYKAYQQLKAEGVNVGLVNMRSIKPIDEDAILKAVSTASVTFTIEDHFKKGGLYTAVAECLLKHQTTGHVEAMAMDEKWFKPALLQSVLEYEGFTAEQIKNKILTTLNSK